MPIALMLQASTRALLSGSARVSAWNELVELEALLVARARSAFLVRWFGTSLPLAGSKLRIAIDNLPALRARYQALEAATRTPEVEGLDVVQPLAGVFGSFLGSFINPLVLLTVLFSGAFSSIKRIAGLLAGVVLGPLGVALLGAAGPFLLIPLLFSSPKELVEGYPLALAVGALLPPLTEFFAALDANFEAIFGSLIDLAALFGIGDAPSPPGVGLETATKILEGIAPIADELAVLVPILLGGLAFLIVKIGPLLEPLSRVLPAFLRFVVSAIEALGAMFKDVVDGFKMLFDDSKGALKVLKTSLNFQRRLLAPFKKHFGSLFKQIKGIVADRKTAFTSTFETLIGEMAFQLENALLAHPLIKFFDDLITQAKKLISEILSTLHKAARAAAGGIGEHVAGPIGRKMATDLVDDLVKWLTKPSKSTLVDDLIAFLKQAIPDHKKILAGLAPPLTVAEALPGKLYSEQPPAIPAELLERHSVFDAERVALLRGPSGKVLLAADERERRLRGFLFDVIAKLLPEKAAPHLASLRGFLQTLDREIDREKGQRELPVRIPEDPAKLRSVMRKVRVVVHGAGREAVDRWAADLKALLLTREPAPALAVGAR